MTSSYEKREYLTNRYKNLDLRWRICCDDEEAIESIRMLDEKYLDDLIKLKDDQLADVLELDIDSIPKVLDYRRKTIDEYGNHISEFMISNFFDYMDADNYPDVKKKKEQ